MGGLSENESSGGAFAFSLDDTANGVTGASLSGAGENGIVDSELADAGHIGHQLSTILTEQLRNGFAVVLLIGKRHLFLVDHKGHRSGGVKLAKTIVERHNEIQGVEVEGCV